MHKVRRNVFEESDSGFLLLKTMLRMSEAVKKFTRILLGSYAEQIEPATCQNYFVEAANSVSRDFFFVIAR